MRARIMTATRWLLAPGIGALMLGIGFFASAGTAGAQTLPECSYSYPSGQAEYNCFCPAGRGDGSIWGTDIYTSDSDICTAAKHAGYLGKAGGEVRVVMQPGQGSYPSSTQNGITSSEWGSYSESIEFYLPGQAITQRLPGCAYNMPSDQTEYACTCAPNDFDGSVWGSGTYTSDSSICTAALHAGAVGLAGGDVHVVARPGLEKYSSTTQNGVTSSDWGSYSSSIEFVQATPVAPMPMPMANGPVCGKFPVGASTHDCVCGTAGSVAAGPVWGSNPYVTDSDICEAARHAGVIGNVGGAVRLFGLPGLESYKGSQMNGVTSYDWGAYGASMSFDGNLR